MPRVAKRALIDFAKRRREMVQHQVAARGVRSELVLEAMRKVPREEFLPSHLREFAYEDTPLPIAEGQTISQPYSGRLSLVFRPRCGATMKCAHSSIGCAITMLRENRRLARLFMDWIYTVCTIRSALYCSTWTKLTHRPQRSRANDTMPDALAVRSGHLRLRGAYRQISDLRNRRGARPQRSAQKAPSLRRS